VKPREVIDRGTTPDGSPLELAIEHGHYIIRVGDVPLMSSHMHGSEKAMATFAREELGERDAPRVLVGGLGMGFTLRATLDEFGEGAAVTVSELLPKIIEYARGPLAHLADRPLEDARVTVHEGDVREALEQGDWDVILMDVDNGPDAFTTQDNDRLYSKRGVDRLTKALNPGGVLTVWSAYPSPRFAEHLRHTGMSCRIESVRGRWPLKKGPKHTLFIATRFR